MGAADVLLDLAATWSGAGRPGSGRGLDEAPEPPLWRQRVAAAAAAGRLDAAGGGRAPVIFIPPLTGVQLELSLHNKPAAPHFWCRRSTRGWLQAWFNPRMLLPWTIDCWADNLRVECDGEGGRCGDPAGVAVKPVPGFESGMRVAPGEYFETFAPLAAALEQLGWRRGTDMLAHLYDWRLPPGEWVQPGGYFDALQRQIEEAVQAAGRPAVAISLSMGAPYLALFLRRHVAPAWQARHIAGHIAISGVWGGCLDAPLTTVAGADGAQYGRAALRTLLRALPVLPWLAPAPAVFGGKTLVVDEATGKRYTAQSLGAWLRVAGASQAAEVWEASLQYMEDLSAPPNHTLYCLYSTGIETTTGVTVSLPGLSPRYKQQFSDGDGVVPLRSLQACDAWQQAAPAGRGPASGAGGRASASGSPSVHIRRYQGLRHAALLRDAQAFADIVEAVLELAGPRAVGAWS